MAHKWARWLHDACRLAGPHRSEVTHKWAGWLHKPCRLGGSPPFQSGRRKQRWPASGHGGYITPAGWGVPTASKRGAESQEAHKWARCLHNPCRLGGLIRFRAGGRNHSWPKSAQRGHITPAAWGVPIALAQGAESQVANK